LLDERGQSLSRSAQVLLPLHNGQLLIGTLSGLFLFDPIARQWTDKFPGIGAPETRFKDAFEIEPGRVIAATTTGVWEFDVDSKAFSRLEFFNRDGRDIGKSDANSILLDNENRLWIGERNGLLHCFDEQGQEVPFTINGIPNEDSGADQYRKLFQDRDGVLWATPQQDGLIALEPGSLDFKRIDRSIAPSLPTPSTHSIFELSDGTLCFGTENAGVYKLDSQRLPIEYKQFQRTQRSLPFRTVSFLASAPEGDLWVMNTRGQQARFDMENRTVEPQFTRREQIPGRPIFDAVSDAEGNLYLLTFQEIFLSDRESLAVEHLGITRATGGIERFDFPTQLFIDSQGILWLLGGRIFKYDTQTKALTPVPSPPGSPDGRILANVAHELPNGDLWIGTRQRGFHYYNRSENAFTRSYWPSDNPARLNEKNVFDFEVDGQQRLWIATNGGLTRLDTRTDSWENFQDLEGLGNANITGIAFANDGALWAATSKGLYRLDPDTNSLNRLSRSRGLRSHSFSNNAFEVFPDGMLAIGDVNGLNIIDTKKFLEPPVPPKPIVTRLRALDSEQGYQPIPLLRSKQKSQSESIRLKPSQNTITLEFAAFDYSNDPNHSLSYKIDGMVDDWQDIGDQREITFSLSPGRYLFRLRATSNNGSAASEETTLSFTALPHFWQTKTFTAALILSLVLATAIFLKARIRNENEAKAKLEAKVAQRTLELQKSQEEALQARDEAESANRAKSRFLASVTHEIRTPMNGIIGMNHMLMQADLKPELKQYAKTVSRSAESMLDLINDILDISKLESGKFGLERKSFNLLELIEEVAEAFSLEAQEKKLDFKCLPQPGLPYNVIGDPLRVKQAIVNLVGNAIKFTSEGSVSIDLRLIDQSEEKATFECHVKDTGIGISKEARDYLFEAFTQADSSTARKFGGTGLGLSISKSLVEAMNGCIRFESEPSKGTVFWFTFQLDKDLDSPSSANGQLQIEGETLVAIPDVETSHWLAQSLRVAGAAAQVAHNPQEFLSAISNPDSTVAAIIVDQSWIDSESEAAISKARDSRPIRVIGYRSLIEGLEPNRDASLFDETLSYPILPTRAFQALSSNIERRSVEKIANQPSSRESFSSSSKSNVLIVDDNRTNQEVMKAFLSGSGIFPDEASDGDQAVEMCRHRQYDLIFMDCLMPRMDVYDATQSIRSQSDGLNCSTPIVALTANEIKGDRERCFSIGMNAYLSKPIRPQSLMEILDEWLPTETGRKS